MWDVLVQGLVILYLVGCIGWICCLCIPIIKELLEDIEDGRSQ